MKLISHEMPLAMMENHHDDINDYLYVLLHKFLEDVPYFNFVGNYKGTILLDNSCYELGDALANDLIYETAVQLNADIVIAPDVLGDKDKTLERTLDFWNTYPDIRDTMMAVVQGSSLEELLECYDIFIDTGFKKIAFPFCFNWVERDPELQANERIKILSYFARNSRICDDVYHHLLGTWQAVEFTRYRDYDWIKSIDTSNPIMAALDGNRYINQYGLPNKPRSTFDDTFNLKLELIDMDLVMYNVNKFRGIVNGD